MITIYYYAKCSKCREAMTYICNAGITPEVVEYMKDTPTAEELKMLIQKLGINAKDLVRTGEDIYKEKYEGKKMSSERWIKAMIKHPELIQRPIVVKDDLALIGRPPELVKRLIR